MRIWEVAYTHVGSDGPLYEYFRTLGEANHFYKSQDMADKPRLISVKDYIGEVRLNDTAVDLDLEDTSAETIRDARKYTGLSQQKMADIMGIPKRNIENWESGNHSCPAWAERLIIEELERIGYIMNEVRYLVIDERKYEQFVKVYDNLDDANKEAENQWDALTSAEKNKSHIYVLDVMGSDLDDPEDWESYNSGGYCDGRYDSKNAYHVSFGTGAGDFGASTVDEAMKKAKENMSYTGNDVVISDWEGNRLYISKWIGRKATEDENPICEFGSEGFYDEWYEI